MRAKLKHLKRHNRVYTLSSENNYRPMRARIASQLFYNWTSSHNIVPHIRTSGWLSNIPGHVIYAKRKSDHQLFQRRCLNKPGHSDSS